MRRQLSGLSLIDAASVRGTYRLEIVTPQLHRLWYRACCLAGHVHTSEEGTMADELDPKDPTEEQRRSNQEEITGALDEEEEFEDIDEAEEDEEELES